MKTRQQIRVPVPIAVRYKVVDRDQEYKFATLEDISWGGVFLAMDPPAELNQRVIIQLKLAEDNVSLDLWGTVVRVRPKQDKRQAGVGVQFDQLDEDSRSLIQRMVDEEVHALLKRV